MGTGSISFGPFVLDRSAQSLLSGGKPVVLGQRAYALLAALADVDGDVRKADLIEAAWPGMIVEEGNLSVQIAALRKALGARPDGSEWIVTVPRVGYRLVRGAVPPIDDKAPRIPSIAVLPFQNLSADQSEDYFADGVVEDIITSLSRFKSLSVVARNSSFIYKGRAVDVRDVARELSVHYVLEGSVRRAGQKLRVAAQLIDGETGSHVWARNFDGDVSDIFDVQERITETVAGLVFPKLEQAELDKARHKPAESLDAYDLLLRGRQLYWRVRDEDNAEAMSYFMRALEIEPDNARVLSNAANAMQFRITVAWPALTANDRQLCLDLTERSLKAPGGGDPIVVAFAGLTLANNFGQYERGMGLVDVALSENPNSLTVLVCASICYLHCGDIRKSIDMARRSIDLTPSDPGQHWAHTAVSHAHLILGEFEEALVWAERSLAINPDFDCTYWMLMAANAQLGRAEEARRWLATFRTMRPAVTVASIRASQPARYPERMANIYDGLRMAGLPE